MNQPSGKDIQRMRSLTKELMFLGPVAHGSGSPAWKLSDPHPYGVLWRFSYRDMTDQIIGYQSQTPLPSKGDWGVDLKVPIH